MANSAFSKLRRLGSAALAAGLIAVAASPAAATKVIDPAGDFLSSYTGPLNGDLDILELVALRTDTQVQLMALTNGTIGTSPTGFVVWGVNRGAGFPGLIGAGPPAIGPPTLLFDAVVVLGYGGTGRIRTFADGSFVDTDLAPGTITIDNSSLSALIPFSLLPSTGFATSDYTYLAWTRSGLGSQALIADLAPEQLPFTAGAVPEPGTWAMMLLGFGFIGGAMRAAKRRQNLTASYV